jgi:two-component system, cell cycle sensor histidine kinase and response regulator CckA
VISGGRNERRHILYLDYDQALVSLMKRLLERRGYRVSSFDSQEKALAALCAAPDAFHVVVTDYNMPGMSGLDVARAVRTIRADLPVAVASGFVDEALRENADQAGVREVIFKADDLETFCAAVQRLVEGSGNASQSASPT